jgi:hypothetical protein
MQFGSVLTLQRDSRRADKEFEPAIGAWWVGLGPRSTFHSHLLYRLCVIDPRTILARSCEPFSADDFEQHLYSSFWPI